VILATPPLGSFIINCVVLDTLQEMLNRLCEDSDRYGMCICIGKMKSMTLRRSAKDDDELELKVHGAHVENVKEFIYLGRKITWDNDCTLEIKRRIQLPIAVYSGFNTIWKDRNVTTDVKLKLLITLCVFSVLLYAADTWTIKKEDE